MSSTLSSQSGLSVASSVRCRESTDFKHELCRWSKVCVLFFYSWKQHVSMWWLVRDALSPHFPKTSFESSISESRFTRLGEDLSAAAVVRLSSRFSALDAVTLGSILSLENYLRIGNDTTFLGSELSVFLTTHFGLN